MIPESINIGSPWKVLPGGVHDATLAEIKERFATNNKRIYLFEGFEQACISLQAANCKYIFLDGSYITDKPIPGDYDACWDPTNVDVKKLDPVFLDFSNFRQKQKDKYGGEFFMTSMSADGHLTFVEFFCIDKYVGSKKGIIRIQLI